jgi:hypothetical protein
MFEPGVIDLLEVSVHVLSIFTVFQVMTDFVCLYTYEFWLSLDKIVRSSVTLLLPLFPLCLSSWWMFHFNFIWYHSSHL